MDICIHLLILLWLVLWQIFEPPSLGVALPGILFLHDYKGNPWPVETRKIPYKIKCFFFLLSPGFIPLSAVLFQSTVRRFFLLWQCGLIFLLQNPKKKG